MKKKLVSLTLAAVVAIGLMGCGSKAKPDTEAKDSSAEAKASSSEAAAGGEKAFSVTLITMDQMDVHWVKVNKAAEAAVEEYNSQGYDITYNWFAPEVKDNAQQISQIEAAINNGSNVIMIAANDATACNAALQEAISAGIKIVYIDSAAELDAEATFCTDNYGAGEQAGKKMLEILEGEGVKDGTIGIVSAQAGVQSCIDRVDGFSSVFEKSAYTLGEVQYSDGDSAKAQELATNLINDGVTAIYAANDGATTGMGNAAKDADHTVYCIGFDNSSANRTLVQDGAVLAFMAQNPDIMGKDGIEAAIKIMAGEDLGGEVIDTGVSTVTKDNVAEFED